MTRVTEAIITKYQKWWSTELRDSLLKNKHSYKHGK